MRVTYPSTKSCTAGTDSRTYAPRWPRLCGKLQDQLMEVPKVEQRTFEPVQVFDVWQIGDAPALPGVKEPVVAACRCAAGGRLSWRISCWRGAGRSLIWRVACRRGGAGGSRSVRVACWSGVGRRLSPRVTCPSTKSCTAGTDSRVFALWKPHDWGRRGTKSCAAALTRAFTRYVGQVYVASYKISWWRCRRSSSGPSSSCRWLTSLPLVR